MRRKWHDLARHEAISLLIPQRTQWWALEQRGQVESGERIENDDFVRCVGVNGLREWESGIVVVVGDVER